MKKDLIKKLINVFGRVITLLSIVFVGVAIYRLGFDFEVIEDMPGFIVTGLLSAVLIAAGVFVQGVGWKSWLDFFAYPDGKRHTDMREALSVYVKANIGKYLPGNVMHYVERNLFAQNTGAGQFKVALSTVFEIATQVLVALLVAVITSGDRIFEVLDGMLSFDYRKVLMVLLVIAIVFLLFLAGLLVYMVPRVKASDKGIKGVIYKAAQVAREYTLEGFVFTLLKAMLWYGCVMVLGGIVMVRLYCFMGGNPDAGESYLIISGYIIAWVLGFVVPGAPGGIGVREFVLTVVLGSVVGHELILTLMVVHRLITIVGDFIAYLVARLMLDTKVQKRNADI